MSDYVALDTIQATDPGDPLGAAWCDQVNANFESIIEPPMCSVAGSLSVPTGTNTILPAATESYDTDNMHSTVSNTSRITFQTPGRYYVSARVRFPGGAGIRRLVTFFLNGTTAEDADQRTVVGGGFSTIISTDMTRTFTAGQFVEVRVLQDSGGALTVALDEFFAKFESRI